MTRFFRRPLGNILKDLSLIFLVAIIIISLDRFTLTYQNTSNIGEQVEHCNGSPAPCEIVEPVQPVEPIEIVQEPDNGQYNKLYVSSSGNDVNDCTSSAPCLSFEKAQSLANPGDAIYLSGFLGAITVTKSGTAEARLSIVGQDVLLNGLRIEADYINVYSVEVAGAISHGIYVESKYVLIENSIVRNSVTENGINGECPGDNQWGSGIKARIGAENLILRGNTVFNNCGEGIAITRGSNVLVENNVVGSNYSVGIYIDNSYNVIAQNNTVICDDTYLRSDHRMRGMVFAAEEYEGWGMQLHDNSFLNNTVIGCYDSYDSWAAYDESMSVNLSMDGNTSIDSTRHSINISSISENMIISNNILDRPIHIDENLDTSNLNLTNNQVTNQSP